MTRCIVLANVVGIDEVDEDLVDEIGGECREKVHLLSNLKWLWLICFIVWGSGKDTNY